MAMVDVEIASRRYSIACRDGEEEQLRALAILVDRKAQDATAALGSLTEARQLLYASLLLADDLSAGSDGAPLPAPQPPKEDAAVADALERLAARVESLADRLETGGHNP